VRVTGLDHVQLAAPAGCEQAARAFFGELLGLAELEKPEALRGRGGCWFALPDGRQLHVGVERDFAAAAKAHPAFRVSGYDALRERLGGEDDETIPGLRRFYAADPFGNRLEFVESA
jgi:catechol 2,3-dioxygenase-like lactoylglutathione lyase family enzyme